MLEKNVGLGPVELGQLLGPPLLGLVAAGAGDAGRDVPGDQLDEPAVAVVERAVAVERGHQEPVRRAALLQQRHHQRLRSAGPARPRSAGRRTGRRRARPAPTRRAAGSSTGHTAASSGGSMRGAAGWPGGDPADAGQPRAAVVVEQVGQRERQVAQVAAELAGGEGQHLLLGAHHARVGAEVAQRRHPPLADDPLGVLADHAEHADHLRRRRRAAGCRRTCGRSPRGSRSAPGTAAAPRPRSPRPVASTLSIRGPMSSQISAHTSLAGRPSAHGYLRPSVSRR